MQRVQRLLLLLALFTLIPPATAQTLGAPLVQAIEELVEAEVQEQGIVGMTAAIGLKGQLAWTRGFGFADLENDVPATADTVYRLASISKPVTAIAVMQLVEAGKIDLEAPVSTYVSNWPEKRWPVSVRQLLCHQGGVRHYAAKDDRNNTKAYSSVTSALEYFAKDPLEHEPGSKFAYSSYGYNLLGAVVEGASDMTFVAYLEQNVFPKAGTLALQDDSQARIIKHRAQGYRRAGLSTRTLLNSELVDVSYKVPGGGLCSTAADLVRFAQAVESDKLVSAESRAAMWTAQATADGTATSYGLGWQISKLMGERSIGHGGSQAKVKTQLLLLPDAGIVVAVMCNTEDAQPDVIARGILKLLSTERR